MGVGWFEGAVISRAVESDELVESVTEAAEGATDAIDSSVGVTDFVSFGIGPADDLLGNFYDSVENVTDCAAELTSRGVFGAWRGLDVCERRSSHSQCECDQ